MKVKELIKKLESVDQDLHVIVDFDSHGYYDLEKVKVVKDQEGDKFLNLKSSNES